MKRKVTPALFSLVMWSKSCLISRELEASGRLVEDDEAAAQPQRAGDLEKLPLADAEVAGPLVDVDVEPPDVEFLASQAPELAPVDVPQARARLVVEKEILADRQLGDDRRLLVDASDLRAPLRPGRNVRSRLAREADFARVRTVQSGEQADHGRLAGAVPAGKGDRVARMDPHRDIVERERRSVPLADGPRLDQWLNTGVERRLHGGSAPAAYFALFPHSDLSSTFALVTSTAGRRSIMLPLNSTTSLPWSVLPSLSSLPASASSRYCTPYLA